MGYFLGQVVSVPEIYGVVVIPVFVAKVSHWNTEALLGSLHRTGSATRANECMGCFELGRDASLV